MSRKFTFTALAVALGLVAGACSEQADPTSANDASDPTVAKLAPGAMASARAGDVAEQFHSIMDAVNVGLAAAGENYRVAMVEYVTGDGDEVGATILLPRNLGNKQLAFDFVPFDPRRAGTPITNGGWSGSVAGPDDDITYAVDMTGDAVPPLGGLSGAATTAAIDAAMTTWDAEACSALPITSNPDFGVDIGVIAFIFGLGGSPFVLADIQHAGWRDIDFAAGVLGATFTFGFTDGPRCAANPIFSDVDGNGKCDAAFREIYYDPSFSWADDGVTNFDVEAVALHEAGHGLSQAHFGNIIIKNDGSLLRAPAAVMNPFILGQTRTLLGTDEGGHCSIWAEWPNN